MTMWVGLAVCALVGFVAGLAIVGYAVLRLPEDFFLRDSRDEATGHPVRRWAWRIARNLVGVALVVAGVVMLFVPGQGVLTILFGMMLVDFPGKRKVLRKLLARPKMLSSANRWRVKFGKPPLLTPESPER